MTINTFCIPFLPLPSGRWNSNNWPGLLFFTTGEEPWSLRS
jgi:hypothetical protein